MNAALTTCAHAKNSRAVAHSCQYPSLRGQHSSRTSVLTELQRSAVPCDPSVKSMVMMIPVPQCATESYLHPLFSPSQPYCVK